MYNELIKSIIDNDLSEASSLINSMSVSDLNQANAYNVDLDSYFTPLHVAAYYGRTEIVNALIDKQVNINQPTREVYSYAQTILWFLSLGRWSRSGQYTALHLAAKKTHQHVISLLFSHGVDYLLRDLKKNLPLNLEQLCFVLNGNNIEKLDLSMYSLHELPFDRLNILFSQYNFKEITFGKIECTINTSKEKYDVYFKLIDAINKCTSIKILHLNMSFLICTSTTSNMLDSQTYKSLELGRKNFVKIINETIKLVSNKNTLEFISVGELIHKNTNGTLRSRTEYVNGKATVVCYTDYDTTKYELLSFTDKDIHHVAAHAAEVKEALLEKNNKHLNSFIDVKKTFFNANLHEKSFDPEIFVSACVILSKILSERQVKNQTISMPPQHLTIKPG